MSFAAPWGLWHWMQFVLRIGAHTSSRKKASVDTHPVTSGSGVGSVCVAVHPQAPARAAVERLHATSLVAARRGLWA